MKTSLTALTSLLLIGACGAPANTATDSEPAVTAETAEITYTAEDIAAETEAINLWFEEKFQESVARSPMTKTYLGFKDEDYGRWDDPSMANAERELEIQRAVVAEMQDTFTYEKLDQQAKLSWRIAEYQLDRAETDWPFRYHSYTFNQMFGAQSRIPAFLINQHRIATPDDARDYISRLNGVEAYLGGAIEIAEESARRGIQPPTFVYEYVLSDSKNIIAGYPFEGRPSDPSPIYEDIKGKIDALVSNGSLSEPEATSLMVQASEAMLDSVGPAFGQLITMLETQQALANEDDGVWKLPDGEAYYTARLAAQTTTDMTASEIHDLGLAETERIHNEMRTIMETVGFEGDLQDFFEFMRSGEQFYLPNTDEGRAEYITGAIDIIAGMEARLPEVFNRFPKADMIVKAVEPFREKSAGKAFYQRPSADGSRPGTYYANLYRMEDMPTYQMEALAFHEGTPGHHMQIAIQQELEGVPNFRKFSGVTAYS
ncbi:MAG: DUF885 domain-containing protein, partial [Pseudomonadota bacterium]